MKMEIAITAYRCKKCGRLHYPFHDRCLDCRGREFEQVKPEGEAKLLAYTAIYNLPWGFDQRYLIIGIAEFANKIKAMGQIRVESVEQLKRGLKMTASWQPVRMQNGEAVYGLMYEPMR
jgi:uncharacterized OB-fold protein